MSRRMRPRPHSGPLRMAGFVASIGAVVALAASGPATVGGFDAPEPRSSSRVPELRSPDVSVRVPATIRIRRCQPTIPAAAPPQAWPSAWAPAPGP